MMTQLAVYYQDRLPSALRGPPACLSRRAIVSIEDLTKTYALGFEALERTNVEVERAGAGGVATFGGFSASGAWREFVCRLPRLPAGHCCA